MKLNDEVATKEQENRTLESKIHILQNEIQEHKQNQERVSNQLQERQTLMQKGDKQFLKLEQEIQKLKLELEQKVKSSAAKTKEVETYKKADKEMKRKYEELKKQLAFEKDKVENFRVI